MPKAAVIYNTIPLDGEEIQFRDIGGRAVKLPVLVDVNNHRIELVRSWRQRIHGKGLPLMFHNFPLCLGSHLHQKYLAGVEHNVFREVE